MDRYAIAPLLTELLRALDQTANNGYSADGGVCSCGSAIHVPHLTAQNGQQTQI